MTTAQRHVSMLKFILIIFNITLLVEGLGFPPYVNIALNKPANQSSVIEDYSWRPALLANDGKKNNEAIMERNSCIHTTYKNSPRTAWWTVDLEFISSIHEVIITSRNWTAGNISSNGRLAGFSIYVSNNSNFLDGTRCFKQSGNLPEVSTTSYPCTATGQFVTVYNERLENVTYPAGYSEEAILELCEVELPGCREQKFGINCNKDCFCRGITCDYISGECNEGCEPGYTGFSCNEICPVGSYGDACSANCSHCAGDHTCNNTGKCTYGCEVGYFTDYNLPGCPNKCGNCQGYRCNEGGRCPGQCVPGFYSKNCTLHCPTTCFEEVCAQTNGTCTRCSAGHFGHFCEIDCPAYCAQYTCHFETGYCQECKFGRYGDKCEMECKHCGGNTACYRNGTCVGECEPGYTKGQTGKCVSSCRDCDEEAGKESVHSPITYLAIGAAGGISFVLVIIAIIAIMYRRKRNEKKRRAQVYCKTERRRHADGEHVYDHLHSNVSEGHTQQNKSDRHTTTIREEISPSNIITNCNIPDKVVHCSGDYYNQALET